MPGMRTSDALKSDSRVRVKRFRFQSQNLSDQYRDGNHVGFKYRKWKHGRCWFNFGDYNGPGLRIEWNVLSGRFGFGLEYGGWNDDVLNFYIGFLLVSLYFGISWTGTLASWIQSKDRVEWGASIHDGGLYWDMGGEWGHWRRSDPWYKHGSLNFLDTLFGRTKHHETLHTRTETAVGMPEGAYPCVVMLKNEWWTRKRTGRLVWHRRNGAEIRMMTPIPFPGKGENSWDCGDDAMHSLHCTAENTEQAIAAAVESVLRSRRRHGGQNWKPKP